MPEAQAPGCFVAVVGPSGAGKDTVLSLAAQALRDDPRFLFARRVVTRAVQPDAEDHDVLSPERFAQARERGAFCLHWRAHGLDYGLPAVLAADCGRGRIVVANLSRRVLGEAASVFPALHAVEISAPPERLAERILARGRESRAEVETRLARNVPLDLPAGAAGRHRIDNSGRPEDAAAHFVALLKGLPAGA